MLDRPSYKLLPVDPAMVTQVWPIVSKMINEAFAASDAVTPPDLLDELRAGTRLLWVVVAGDVSIVAAGMTTIRATRTGKLCKILETGGEHARQWAHLRGVIEAYAKSEGCDRVVIEGRLGWTRMFPDYKTVGVILEKRI